MLTINLENKEREVEDGSTYYQLALEYEKETGKKPFLIKANGIVKELRRHVRNNEQLEFIYYDNDLVKEAYARTAIFIMLKVFYEVYGDRFDPSLKFRIHNSYYFEFENTEIKDEDIPKIADCFKSIVESDYFIAKKSYAKQEILDIFERKNMKDAKLLFKFNYRPVINLREINGFVKYINGMLLRSTSYVSHYDIRKFHNGILLALPKTDDIENVATNSVDEKLFHLHNVSVNWAKKLRINTVGKLNEQIAEGNFNDLVIMTESFQDKQIGDIASEIAKSGKKLVFIAGPSSSGKTSFSRRLMYHLRALELIPHPISCDDFFKEREETPKNEKGEYDFESLGAVDIKLLNDTLNKLLKHEEVTIPQFDFAVGTKVFGDTKLKIEANDIVILEGIHCLNKNLIPSIDVNNVFRVYVSALTEVSIDNANRIPTSDLRLLRRLVRDRRTRGTSPKTTLKRWKSVREGEEKNIFPFQEEADVVFNSALIYEFSVLKIKALPELYQLSEDPEVGETAKRLIKTLNYFLGVDTEIIPKHSLVREFIGGSVLDVG